MASSCRCRISSIVALMLLVAVAALGIPRPVVLGDMNCDGVVDNRDIQPFLLAVNDPAAYAAQYPFCRFLNADINQDGSVNALDVQPFFDLQGIGIPTAQPAGLAALALLVVLLGVRILWRSA